MVLSSPIVLAAVVAGGVRIAKPQRPEKQGEKEPRVTSMPAVFSKVKKLEVIRAWIVRQDTDVPAVSIEIKNNSDKDALAVDLVCGDGGITRNGLHDDEHPIVVLKAHGTMIMEINFSEMTFGAPLVVSAVTWADGTEEGDKHSLKMMHGIRERDRAMKRQNSAVTPKEVPTP